MNNKNILIIALVFLSVAVSVAGYFVYRYYFLKEKEMPPEEVLNKAEEFVDCGRSATPLESFDDPFFNTDFDEDNAFVCMGENIENNCSKAGIVIDVGGVDLTYKITKSNSLDCKARFETKDSKGSPLWIECPIPGLMSFAQKEAENIKEFGMIIEKMGKGAGDHGAGIFALMALTLSFDKSSFEQLGCSRSD